MADNIPSNEIVLARALGELRAAARTYPETVFGANAKAILAEIERLSGSHETSEHRAIREIGEICATDYGPAAMARVSEIARRAAGKINETCEQPVVRLFGWHCSVHGNLKIAGCEACLSITEKRLACEYPGCSNPNDRDHRHATPHAQKASEPQHGGRPMTLRECMDAEDGGST